MANNDLQELRDKIINTSAVLEGIMRARKTTIEEKVDLLLERMINTSLDIVKMRRARDDSQKDA